MLNEQARQVMDRRREELGDGGAEGSSAIGDGGQAEILLMPDVDAMHTHIFDSSKLEDLYHGDLLYYINRHGLS